MKYATCHPEKPAEARGLCANCYSRSRRLGFPTVLPPKRHGGTKAGTLWFCECEDSAHDVMGQCDRCGRVTLEAVEKSLGLR